MFVELVDERNHGIMRPMFISWVYSGAGFARQLPNSATPLYSPNKSIHFINEFRHPMLLIKVPAAVLADHLIAYTQ
jgi:hypothetical protein